MRSSILSFFCLVLFLPAMLGQSRQQISFNDHWLFNGQQASGLAFTDSVTLPHSWNDRDAQEGIPYYRGTGQYTKTFIADPLWQNKRVFIHFEGANIVTHVALNGQEIGEHRGGYAAFAFELTNAIDFEKSNELVVSVSNQENTSVIPLVGDFNNYGGIYRPVHLLITESVCITPLDYASPGIYIKQKNVSVDNADVEVLTKFSSTEESAVTVTYESIIRDASGEIIAQQDSELNLSPEVGQAVHSYQLSDPHLWQGRKDPYLYQVQVNIWRDGQLIDTKTEPLGLRFFEVSADEGFFLNGQHVRLNGVSRHQDRQDHASAISNADHEEDMSLMLEMGISALRLAHYQHAEKIYDLADSAGLIVWAEIPFVGVPGGFMGSNGYVPSTEFHENVKQQLFELIRQNFNHPSILMWSIFNEIQDPEEDSPLAFVRELHQIVKDEDPSRLSVGAHMIDPEKHPAINEVTDLIAYNRYYGWYYGKPSGLAEFLDQLHQAKPDYKIGISEYGAGGSIFQHSDKLRRPNPMGSPHPEEYQSYYHEENLKIIDERPFVWGTFIWNMFDFGSHFRKEGDRAGINDKGMVTYDRKTKKDVFYFYKANWSEEPVLHITSSRYRLRTGHETKVKVYTNLPAITLTVNGVDYPAKSPEKGMVTWENIQLNNGVNGIIVTGEKNGRKYTDDCVWVVEGTFQGLNLFRKILDFTMVAWWWIAGFFVMALIIYFRGIKKSKYSVRWKRILWWTAFVVIALICLLMLAVKVFVPMLFGG